MLYHPNIDPIAFYIGPFEVWWYGIAYFLSFILGWRYVLYLRLKTGFNVLSAEDIDDFVVWQVIGTVLGGRLGYVILYRPDLLSRPSEILATWHGGMSFHGASLGLAIVMLLFAFKKRINVFYLSDLIATFAPFGLLLGRLANFVNQELNGRVTDVPWGMVYPRIDDQVRHPSQLYEAFGEGVVLFILLQLLFYKFKAYQRPGYLTSVFIIGYSIVRIVCENYREPDEHIGYVINGLTMGQVYSVLFFVMGAGIFLYSRLNHTKNQR